MKSVLKRLLIIIQILIFAINTCKADKQTLDSLFSELDKLVEDSVKIDLFNDLSWEVKASDPYKSIEYAYKAYNLSISNRNKSGEASAYNNLGNAFYFLSYFDTALYFYNKSYEVRESLGDLVGISSSLNNIGMIYELKGEYDSTIAKYSQALKIKEDVGDTSAMINVLSNIGVVYMALDKNETALDFFHKCIFLEKYASDYVLGNIYSNLGLIYYNYADSSKGLIRNEYFNVSLSYYNKSVEMREQAEDIFGLSHTYTNIANLYAHFGLYKEAIEKYESSIKIQNEIEDLFGLSHNQHDLARMHYNLHQYHKAIEYTSESQKTSIEIGNFNLIKDNFKLLSIIYEESGSYNKSLQFYKRFAELEDSLINLEVLQQLNELQVAYNTKETELKLLKKEEELKSTQLSKNKLFNLGLIMLVVVSIVFAFFLHAALKRNRKANQMLRVQNNEIREQKNQIAQQKEEIENKNTILNDTYQLLAIKNKDITDSLKYARNIQQAILPDNEIVKKLLPHSFILFLPKDYVSGDFYWVEENWGKIYFAAADCTGHGVPGAFMSIVGYNLLNKAINEHYLFKPSDILAYISKGFQITIKKHNKEYFLKAGMDIALCSLDCKKMKLEYAGAFNSLYIVRNGELLTFKADLYPIGRAMEPKENYTNHEINLQKDDMIYIFSDGFSDQFGGPHDRKFMTKRMKQAFLNISNLEPEKQKDQLEEIFYKWKKGNDQIDDVLVFGIKV